MISRAYGNPFKGQVSIQEIAIITLKLQEIIRNSHFIAQIKVNKRAMQSALLLTFINS
jgi:hypothetical protein